MTDGPPTPRLRVTATPTAGRTTLAIAGEVDVASALELLTAASDHLARGPVLLDLSAVTFLDSSGVHALNALLRDVDREGWDLVIASELTSAVEKVLRLTGLLDVLPLSAPSGAQDRR